MIVSKTFRIFFKQFHFLRLVLLLLPLFLLSVSFFWEDEEKQLRQLNQSAEAALQDKRYEEAKKAFSELLGRIDVRASSKYRVDWRTYIDLVTRFAEACDATNDKAEGEKAVSKLLEQGPPPEFLPKIKFLKARLSPNPEESYAEMKKIITSTGANLWSKQELLLFHALEHALNSRYDDLVKKAKRFLAAGFYETAISLYKEILTAIEKGYYPKASYPHSLIPKKICYRLAESHFHLEHYDTTLSLLDSSEPVVDQIDHERIYLAAVCHKRKKEYEKALELFQQYAQDSDRPDLDHYSHALFEIGLFFFNNGNLSKARSSFEQLIALKNAGKPKSVATLYLARIYLKTGSANCIEKLLSPLSKELAAKDPLRFESFYLRGMAAYHQGAYAAAREFFEQSLPADSKKSRWTDQARYHLGWCLVKLGEDQSKPKQVRQTFFNKAEETFLTLFPSQEREAAVLSLARLHLLRYGLFEDPIYVQQAASLLMEHQEQFSLSRKHEAYLLQAEAASSYEAKEKWLEKATDSHYKHVASYADAWKARGLNHFQEGIKNPIDNAHYFEKAVAAFELAFSLVEKNDKEKAAGILKLEAKANFYCLSPKSSLALLEKLLTQFNETVEEREETLFLRGLVASHLHHHPVAEESFLQVIKDYPQGKYTDHALHALGTLYFHLESYDNAKEVFCRLANEHPHSSLAGEALFWAAEAEEKSGNDPFPYRELVYQCYPDCIHAAEAYFKRYPYQNYFEGNPKSISHLKNFADLFPKSPFLIVSHFLIGMHEESFEVAQEAFQEGLKAFSICLEEGKTPDAAYVYFHYQTMLKLGLRHMKEGDYEKSLLLFNSIIHDFSQEGHPLTSLLKQKTSYPSLFEESEFSLAQCYLCLGKEAEAEKVFSRMLCHYEKSDIREGYYLSEVWREQGKLAMRCNDYKTALSCFSISEECGFSALSDDQKLSLWILQSDCNRQNGELDTAMRLLSKVINAEIASPLRLQAMYKRAEIYDLQGRHELAQRQLEAAAKKGKEAWN